MQIPAVGSQLHQAFRPAFWDSKLYGEPFGNFHRCRLPASAKANGASSNEKLPYQKRIPSAQVGDLARLEQTMRAVVNRRATVHAPEKVQLLNAFAKALGKRRAEVKDTVGLEQFQQAWRQFDVALSHIQAEAIFNKYGQVRFALLSRSIFLSHFGTSSIVTSYLIDSQGLESSATVFVNVECIWPYASDGICERLLGWGTSGSSEEQCGDSERPTEPSQASAAHARAGRQRENHVSALQAWNFCPD